MRKLLLLLFCAVPSLLGQTLPPYINAAFTGSSAAGVQQIFTATYGDPYGVANIDVAELAISNCRVSYEFGAFWLVDDAQDALLGPIYSGSGALSNSTCTVINPTVSTSSDRMSFTLTLPLSFSTAAAGSNTVLGYVAEFGRAPVACRIAIARWRTPRRRLPGTD